MILSELPGFTHKGENGALGEAIADMFASNLDDELEIGENLPGGTLRDMEHPDDRLLDRDRRATATPPTTRATTSRPTIDQGGVHINAGIPNRAYVAMVESLGRDASQRILYDAVTEHLRATPGSRTSARPA